jgi:hypothetical protein
MSRPVRLLFFTQTIGCETCPQTKQILDELPPLSDRITIEEVNLVLDKDRAALSHLGTVAALTQQGVASASAPAPQGPDPFSGGRSGGGGGGDAF